MTSITAPYASRDFGLRSSQPLGTPNTRFASTFGSPSPFSGAASTPTVNIPNNRLTTPLAPPPPPPLYKSAHEHVPGPDRQVRYAGADHTLGPTFSEEEDGDDSAFIAAKMAALGLDPNGVPYNQGGFAAPNENRYNARQRAPQGPSMAQILAQAQRQLQLQQLAQLQQAQQQQALVQLLAQQSSQQQLRDSMAILELQQAQQAATDRQYQSQSAAQQQAQRGYHSAQRQPGYEAKRLAQQQQILQMQQQQQQQNQYLQQLQLQQQLTALQPAPSQQPQPQPSQRNALAAQMQANLQARTGRVAQARGMTLDDAELRARFEAAAEPIKSPPVDEKARYNFGVNSVPTTAATSPSDSVLPTSPSWRSSQSPSPTKSTTVIATPTSSRTPRGGRFAQARQEMAADGDSFGFLTAAFQNRVTSTSTATSKTDDRPVFVAPSLETTYNQIETASTSPTSVISDTPAQTQTQTPQQQEKSGRYVPGLGFGRPSAHLAATVRSSTNPSNAGETLNGKHQQGIRSVSQPPLPSQTSKLYVVRQPLGPPGEAKELGDKNFQALQARIRRQAGLNLGMLGRRTESPLNTPVVA
ncbi:hypothetical protein CI109_103111 [Kwoniella shandongensis]|uniref:Uncharacterized protein n=1 Tax=Kwoniella shandongensis TaxID=1734106 RepID=A0A5M6CA40_9TREE|nr:uncharacterized protein CI109_000301 [Kwoniella shandongensis]KAA5531460.1 hypothetical protein CI109_000301 [Kwoniella shandongensis]